MTSSLSLPVSCGLSSLVSKEKSAPQTNVGVGIVSV